jgi:hypothetical protein
MNPPVTTGLALATVGVLFALPARPAGAEGGGGAPAAVDFQRQVVPLLERYCVGCHGGPKKKADLALDVYRAGGQAAALANLSLWQEVAARLEAREMPPEEKQPQPSEAERATIIGWIEEAAARAAATGKRDPGRVTIRRLNRAEYNNTVRDLLGVDLRLAQDFPSDDVGYGFDNIGDVLTVAPVLFERYMTAAEQIAERAIVGEIPPRLRRLVVPLEAAGPPPAGSGTGGRALVVNAESKARGARTSTCAASTPWPSRPAAAPPAARRLASACASTARRSPSWRSPGAASTRCAASWRRASTGSSWRWPTPRPRRPPRARARGPCRWRRRRWPDHCPPPPGTRPRATPASCRGRRARTPGGRTRAPSWPRWPHAPTAAPPPPPRWSAWPTWWRRRSRAATASSAACSSRCARC